jgi:hypothetical protein
MGSQAGHLRSQAFFILQPFILSSWWVEVGGFVMETSRKQDLEEGTGGWDSGKLDMTGRV